MNDIETLSLTARRHLEEGNASLAVGPLERVLELQPTNAAARTNLGTVYGRLGRFEDAEKLLADVVLKRPELPDAWNSLGNVQFARSRYAEAALSFAKALELRPDFAHALVNLGGTLTQLELFNEALACFERGLNDNPQSHPLRFNQSLVQLLTGDFARGWASHEWRPRAPAYPARCSTAGIPAWRGPETSARRILLYPEQGLGDMFMLSRFASRLATDGYTVTLAMPDRMQKIMQRVDGVARVISYEEDPPKDLDAYASLASMPYLLGSTMTDLSCQASYLKPPSTLRDDVARLLDRSGRLNVGIGWQGNPHYPLDRDRSVPIENFARLARIEGVAFLSLQKGFGQSDLARVPELRVVDAGSRLDLGNDAFWDTAALLTRLDLVITSDTALAHLAGALGVPAWILLPKVPDWRWLLAGDSSPWYPSLRLFRQSQRGNWSEVFERVASALELQIAIPN